MPLPAPAWPTAINSPRSPSSERPSTPPQPPTTPASVAGPWSAAPDPTPGVETDASGVAAAVAAERVGAVVAARATVEVAEAVGQCPRLAEQVKGRQMAIARTTDQAHTGEETPGYGSGNEPRS